MWHLILPPLIIISGIGVLLWFVSRKMNDLSFLSRVKSAKREVSAVSHSRSLSRKAFFLKLLETFASRFKTNSLRAHNFFQYFLERLREKRKAIDIMRREMREAALKHQDSDTAPIGVSRRWFGFRRKKSELIRKTAEAPVTENQPVNAIVPEAVSSDEVERPFAIGSFKGKRQVVDTVEEESVVADQESSEAPLSPRPVLREVVVHPDKSKYRADKKDPREEELIMRIAENPRDAAAYEKLGDLYLEVENMQDAKACYQQVLKLHPTNRAVKLKIRKVGRFFEESVL